MNTQQIEEEWKGNGGGPQGEIGRGDMDVSKVILKFMFRIQIMIMWARFF
jgi:hypothetical protein